MPVRGEAGAPATQPLSPPPHALDRGHVSAIDVASTTFRSPQGSGDRVVLLRRRRSVQRANAVRRKVPPAGLVHSADLNSAGKDENIPSWSRGARRTTDAATPRIVPTLGAGLDRIRAPFAVITGACEQARDARAIGVRRRPRTRRSGRSTSASRA
jgi:hypothetical protein